MKKIIMLMVFLLGVILPCKATTPSVITKDVILSVYSSMPLHIEYVDEDGEKCSQDLIEIWGYPSQRIYNFPSLSIPRSLDYPPKEISVKKDYVEGYYAIDSNEDYALFINGNSTDNCEIFDEEGYLLSKDYAFQCLWATEFDYVETSIFNLLNTKGVSNGRVLVDMDEFADHCDENLCQISIIELDENDSITYSANVYIPLLGGLGTAFIKKSAPETCKLYYKVVQEGIVGTLLEAKKPREYPTM